MRGKQELTQPLGSRSRLLLCFEMPLLMVLLLDRGAFFFVNTGWVLRTRKRKEEEEDEQAEGERRKGLADSG